MKLLVEGNQKIIEIVKKEAENHIGREEMLLFLQSLGAEESVEYEGNIC